MPAACGQRAVGGGIVADKNRVLRGDPGALGDDPHHVRVGLADAGEGHRPGNGPQRRQKRTGLRHGTPVSGGVGDIGVGHPETGTATDQRRQPLQIRDRKRQVPAQERDLGVRVRQRKPKSAGFLVHRIACKKCHRPARIGTRQMMQRLFACQQNAALIHRQPLRGEHRRERLGGMGGIVGDDPKSLCAGAGKTRSILKGASTGHQTAVQIHQDDLGIGHKIGLQHGASPLVQHS